MAADALSNADDLIYTDSRNLWGSKRSADPFPTSTSPINITYTFIDPTFGLPAWYTNPYTYNPQFDADLFSARFDLSTFNANNELSTAAKDAVNTILVDPSSLNPFRVSFSDVTHLTFSPFFQTGATIQGVGNITLMQAAKTTTSPGLTAEFPSPYDTAAVMLDSGFSNTNYDVGHVGYWAALHELTHALGLKHPDESGLGSTYLDSTKYSVVSTLQAPDFVITEFISPYTLQLMDIKALQDHWGSRNYDVRADPTTYNVMPSIGREGLIVADNQPFLYTIWDGNGIDVIDASGYNNSSWNAAAEIDLRQGHFSSIGSQSFGTPTHIAFDDARSSADPDPGNVAIAFHTVIENALGTKWDDILIGNGWLNSLSGSAGNDKLFGDGYVYDGDHGFHLYDGWDANDPNRSIPLSDDDTLKPGIGQDESFGGFGNDTFIASEDGVGHLEGDLYNGGGYVNWLQNGDSVEIDHKVDGFDTVDYSGIGFGLRVDFSAYSTANGLATVQKASDLGGTFDRLISIEHVIGTNQNDTFVGGDGHSMVFDGMGGNDTMTGGNAADTLTGGTGNDTLTGGGSGDMFVFHPGDGTDTITDYHQAEGDILRFLDGKTATDLGFSRSGNNEIVHDDDVILKDFFAVAGPHVITVQFDSGTVNFLINDDGTATIAANVPPAAGGGGGAGLLLTGTSGNDVLNGSDNSDSVNGLAGDDIIYGHNGGTTYDILYGGGGSDIIFAGASGYSYIYGEYLFADVGDDQIFAGNGGSHIEDANGNNFVLGGDGDDTILFGGYNNWTDGQNTAYGGAGNDTLWLDSYGDGHLVSYLDGGTGNDYITAFFQTAGHNTLIGGAGNDSVIGSNSGYDLLVDGAGQDIYHSGANGTIVAAADGEHDEFYGQYGTGTLDLSAAKDSIVLSGHGSGDNLISADLGNGIATGLGLIIGGSGDDTFVTSTFDSETISGGAGNDYFEGGSTAVGGAGADTFAVNIFSGNAGTVLDYRVADEDLLLLKGLATRDSYQNMADLSHLVGGRSGDDFTLEAQSAYTYNLFTLKDFFVSGTQKIIVDFNDDALGPIALKVASDGTLTQDYGTGTSGDDSLTGTSGNDVMSGFGGSDTLSGAAGNDTLDGGTGADTMTGGTGNDTYVVGPGDVVSENPAEGTDTVLASISYTLTDNVENLTLTGSLMMDGTGNGLDNVIVGNAATNTLTGGAGSDTYVFSNASGQDVVNDVSGTLDTISFDATVAASSVVYGRVGDDLAIENGTPGDSITVTGFFTAADTIEQVTFADSTVHNAAYIAAHLQFWAGTSGNDTLTGTSGNDTLYGLAGNDTLSGLGGNDLLDGGAGADSMTGGTGNDVYVVDNAGDLVTESVGAGTDTVQSSVTYTLTADVENLTLTGSDSINGTGNGGANIITGNSGDNALAGAAGSDTYIFSNGSGHDVVTDSSGTLDTISFDATVAVSSVTYTRVGNDLIVDYGTVGDSVTVTGFFSGSDTIERVTFSDSTVHDAAYIGGHLLSATGTSGDDTISGGSGADVINGLDGNDVLYGLGGNDTLNGGNGNDTLDGGTGNDILTGGAGNDTYVVDSTSDSLTDTSGTDTDTVQSSVTWTLGTDFENLTLTGAGTINGTGNSGANIITGNGAANTLTGNGGTDTLDGGGGADTLIGGTGSDTYIVDVSGDSITDSGGTDLVLSSATTYTLGSGLENLTLTGTLDISGTGNSGVNTITGNGGNDTLDGAGGADILIGGIGNDTYGVDNTGDSITDAGGTADTILSSITLSISSLSNIENLTLTGTAVAGTGNTGNNILTGDSIANTLTGNGGTDTLDGGGGADTLIGGTGNDTYIVDVSNDSITDTGGIDTVLSSSTTFSIATFTAIENLTLIGSAVTGTGNSGVNIITGNSGNNTLDGGTGADSLIGGLGNDLYLVDNASDSVTEATGGGTDTVQSGISYTLTAGQDIEYLTLTGTTVLTGTGNGIANTLTGNTAADTLAGGDGDDTYVITNVSTVINETSTGGTADTVQFTATQGGATYTLAANVENLTMAGAVASNGVGNAGDNVLIGNSATNTLTGGAGNDAYYVQNAMDVVVESTAGTSGGTDTVYSTVSFTLGTNVENLTLTGSTAVIGTGNASANTIIGNSIANSLDGLGGTDSLVGGDGNDTYFVDVSSDVIIENAGEGTADIAQFSSTLAGATYALSDYVENLTLTGTFAINGTGNASDNTLTGNTGNNVLTGGAGNDTYFVQNTGDSVVETTSGTAGGTDLVSSSVTFTLGTNVENLTLTGSTSINGTGNGDANVITSNAGTNTLTGGDGDDTFYINSTSDVIVEGSLSGSGTDIAFVTIGAVSYTMTNNVEKLTLLGTSNTNVIGNSLDNVITGNSGRNSLDGGIGADTLIGGGDIDTYLVDNTLDVIFENPNEGIDIVQFTSTTADATYTLAANVDNLTLMGTSNINGTGNSDVNVLTGNSGNNTLDGRGGADSMIGSTGNDTYIVDDTGDVVSETSSTGGTDIVLSSASSYTLTTNVENLTLTADNTSGTGNSTANIITGNSGDNTLNGGGGVDTLIGGAGNDTYVVDTTTDTITDASGTADTILSSVSFSIASLGNIENLTLTGSLAATATGNTGNNIITGSSVAQTLTGNGGNDTLDGGGGADTLIGGTGNDTYVIDNTGDTITDTGGHDLVISSITFSLGSNLDDLTLTGSSAINGTGNSVTNIITGNSGDNSLDGGTGTDTLIGGLGNDTYVVDTTTDVITENAGQGSDTILSSITFDLSSNAMYTNVENLTLSGSSAINGTGSSLDNVITGNSGANTLSGGSGVDTLDGGDGLDSLTGGTGGDTFVFHFATAVNNIDVVTDFSTAEGDKLDVRDLLFGYDIHHDITQFLRISNSGGNSIVEIDHDGTGTMYTWQQVATLTGVTGLTDEAALLASGNIIAS